MAAPSEQLKLTGSSRGVPPMSCQKNMAGTAMLLVRRASRRGVCGLLIQCFNWLVNPPSIVTFTPVMKPA